MDLPKLDHRLPGALRPNSIIQNTSPFLSSLAPILNTNNTLASTQSTANILANQLESLNILDDVTPDNKSVLLLDAEENLCIDSEQHFLRMLDIENGKKVKVVSIFGNTGEGKSYTLNRVFFNGDEIFQTSSKQTSCTLGVWAKYDPNLNVICLDTEGLLGVSKKEYQRTRLLLKVLAVSDIIIYRTRSERLQSNMYTFLGGASKAYKDHFCDALKKALKKTDSEKILTGLGPGVIVFHETQHTDTLHESADVNNSAEDILRTAFSELNLSFDGFSFIKYIGSKGRAKATTSFRELQIALQKELESTEVRSARDAKYIYLMLRCLNDKFQSPIKDAPHLYLPAFFTCQEKCLACSTGCTLSMGHIDDGETHFSSSACVFQHQYQNRIFYCKRCFANGVKVELEEVAQNDNESTLSSYWSMIWSGQQFQCSKCGFKCRTREYWYGNKPPEENPSVHVEFGHVWYGDNVMCNTQNFGQNAVDNVNSIYSAVSSVVSKPVKAIGEYSAGFIAPSYWVPDSEIKDCAKCHKVFEAYEGKHHCRDCGKGFCANCSTKRKPVPHRKWYDNVRVCDDCYNTDETKIVEDDVNEADVRARQYGETFVNSVRSMIDVPRVLIKDSVRPSYWIPDNECIQCIKCKLKFGELLTLHHCRECGKGICKNCSRNRKVVKGWKGLQRVCDLCCK